MSASAIVDNASARPPSRSDGRANRAPAAAVAAIASPAAGNSGTPLSIRLPASTAANSANEAWARLTMPPMPVTTVNDRKITANASARVSSPSW